MLQTKETRSYKWCRTTANISLKGHSQLAHMPIRHHFIANLDITET